MPSTAPAPTPIDQYLPATERSILHKYRSWTYNFALSALSPRALLDETLLARDVKDYAVLNSAGKGTKGIQVNQDRSANTPDKSIVSKGVDSFNKNSPGRFDMYIDGVNIDGTIGAGSPEAGPSISSSITFDVHEPYSMNGFFEALQIAAVAAGYTDYVNAIFALRVQFIGYPDGDDLKSPEVIPKSVRYFPIKIGDIGIDVTEAGTRYKISATPFNQRGFGATTNRQVGDKKAVGDTVGEVLADYFNALNEDASTSAESERGNPDKRNIYEISVPILSTVTATQDTLGARLYSTRNGWTPDTSKQYKDFVDAKINDNEKSNNVPDQVAPDKTNSPTGQKYLIVSKTTSDSSGSNGQTTQRPKTVTTFPPNSEIHDNIALILRDSSYTRDLLKPENLEKAKNGDGTVVYFNVRLEVEVGDFDEKNNTYFQVLRYVVEPFKIHYTRIPGQSLTQDDYASVKKIIKREYNYLYTGKNLDVLKFQLKFNNLYFSQLPTKLGNITKTPGANEAAKDNQVVVTQKSVTTENEQKENNSSVPANRTAVSPGQSATVPTAGQNQEDPYAALARSLHQHVIEGVDMITGSLSILGDPYFLCTGGMGNKNLKLSEPMQTDDGQLPHTQGDAYISLTFRNPIDIDEKTGLATFDNNLVDYSGIYRVLTLKNVFRDGQFVQDLDIVRMPGLIVGKGEKKVAVDLKTDPMPGAQITADSAPASVLKSGIRPSDFSLGKFLNRGLPSIGLPGAISSFAGAATAASAVAGGLLSQASGALGSAQAAANQFTSLSGVDSLASGVRLSASGLSSAVTNSVNAASDSVAAATAKINSLQNSVPTDPTGLAQAAGIDTNRLSGIASSLQSQASDQLSAITKQIPTNVDIDSLQKQGLSFANLSADSLKNLPAVQPKDVFKAVPVNVEDLANISPKLPSIPSLPTVASLTANLPSVASLTAQIPSIDSLAAKIPSVSGLVGNNPLTSGLPSLNTLASGNPLAAAGINVPSLTGGSPLTTLLQNNKVV